jgi:hypothetical protein
VKTETGTKQAKEPMKSEQVTGIIVAVLAVVTALVQALPSLIPLVKQMFHIP